jgi:hypothetical protein
LSLLFLLGQHKHEKENDDNRCRLLHRNAKFKKLSKEGRVQNVHGDIDDGNGVMEFTLEQTMAMAQWSSHWNE